MQQSSEDKSLRKTPKTHIFSSFAVLLPVHNLVNCKNPCALYDFLLSRHIYHLNAHKMQQILLAGTHLSLSMSVMHSILGAFASEPGSIASQLSLRYACLSPSGNDPSRSATHLAPAISASTRVSSDTQLGSLRSASYRTNATRLRHRSW